MGVIARCVLAPLGRIERDNLFRRFGTVLRIKRSGVGSFAFWRSDPLANELPVFGTAGLALRHGDAFQSRTTHTAKPVFGGVVVTTVAAKHDSFPCVKISEAELL